MPGVYYPLTRQRAIIKPPTHEVYIVPSDDSTCYGVQVASQFEVLSPEQTVQFITACSRGTWIISYDTIWITTLFSDHLDIITRAETVGEYQNTIIETKYTKVFIVDLFQATNDTIWKASRKLGVEISPIEQDINQHLKTKIAAVCNIWYKYQDAVNVAWEVFPSKTTGATALKAWRATIPDKTEYKVRGSRVNKLARNAIRPGVLNWREGYYPQGYAYDINGSYIHAMRTVKLPTSFVCFINRPPYDRWIATVKLNYKSNLQWGVLPIKANTGQLYRPTEITNFITTITYLDLYLLQMTGKVEIVQWLEGITWQPKDEGYLFNTWIDGLVQASKETDYKYLLKNISRSLHSKFAQAADGKSLMLIQPKTKEETLEYAARKELKDIIITAKGNVILQIEKPYAMQFIPFYFPAWEALILATGRLQLYTAVNQNTIYVDTDSIISTTPRQDLSLSTELGAWKQEAEGHTAIISPRGYLCGSKFRCSGIRATSAKQLKEAILSAAQGIETDVEKIEYGNLIRQTKTEVKNHTVKIEKYPAVVLHNNTFYVTRSPTIEVQAIIHKRLFSLDIE